MKKEVRAMPRILHIEDDQDFSRVIEAALEGRAEIVNATSIKMARGYLRVQLFDLIVLDHMLPDGSSTDLLETIDRTVASPPPIIILSSTEPNEAVRRRAIATLIKSRTPEEKMVETILHSLLSHKQRL